MHVIGRGRTARETYPQSPGAAGFGGGGVPLSTPASGNDETVIVSDLAPTTSGKILAVVDVTPKKSGFLTLSAMLEVAASAPDTVNFTVYYVDELTSVVGGTAISPDAEAGNQIVGQPTSTVPDFSTGDVLFESDSTTSAVGHTVAIANVPVRAIPGHRTLLAIVGFSSSDSTTWTVDGQIVCVEQ